MNESMNECMHESINEGIGFIPDTEIRCFLERTDTHILEHIHTPVEI